MTARRPPEDAVLVLKANEIHAIDVQEIRRSTIAGRVAFLNFKANPGRISVAPLPVVDGNSETVSLGAFGRDGLTQIGCKGSDPAASR